MPRTAQCLRESSTVLFGATSGQSPAGSGVGKTSIEDPPRPKVRRTVSDIKSPFGRRIDGNCAEFVGALSVALVPCAVLAQDPPPTGTARPGRRRPRRPRAGAGNPALRPRHHQGSEVRRGHLHGPPDQGPRLLRNPQGAARPRVPLGQPDRQDDARRRLRRPGGRQPRRQVGAPRRSHPAARRVVRRHRRPDHADRQGRRRGELQPDRDGVQHRGARQGRRRGDRRDAALHDRRAGIQRPDPRRRARVRRLAFVRRARRVVPREHRGRSDPHLQQPAAGSRAPAGAAARPRPVAGAARRRCAPAATAC